MMLPPPWESGLADPESRRTSATQGAFFMLVMVDGAGKPKGLPVPWSRSATPYRPPPSA